MEILKGVLFYVEPALLVDGKEYFAILIQSSAKKQELAYIDLGAGIELSAYRGNAYLIWMGKERIRWEKIDFSKCETDKNGWRVFPLLPYLKSQKVTYHCREFPFNRHEQEVSFAYETVILCENGCAYWIEDFLRTDMRVEYVPGRFYIDGMEVARWAIFGRGKLPLDCQQLCEGFIAETFEGRQNLTQQEFLDKLAYCREEKLEIAIRFANGQERLF